MRILGLSPLDKDSTVSIVEDGQVLFAAAEERFTRNKLQAGFPSQALQVGLKFCGFTEHDIDLVAYPFFDWKKESDLIRDNVRKELDFLHESPVGDTRGDIVRAFSRIPGRNAGIPGLSHPEEKMEKKFLHRLFYRIAGTEGRWSRKVAQKGSKSWEQGSIRSHAAWQEELEYNLRTRGLLNKLKRYDHHSAHAACAYFASGFERALIVTLDGYGSGLAGSVSIGDHGKIRRIHKLEYPHSLGTFYESVTSSLGFKPSRHEGKIVGLAAYGDPKILMDVLLKRFKVEPGNFRIVENNNIYFSRYLSTQFSKIDVAAAYQAVLEIVGTNYIRHYIEKTGLSNIVLAGGVAANVKLNQRIYEIPGVEGVFVYPNMGDGGCGTGAAFLGNLESLLNRQAYSNVYFGPEFSDREIEKELEAASLFFRAEPNIELAIAKLIHEGNVVARFNGRMEYGPRSLGNRSILYRATEPEVNQWLNQRLGRTEFMPFAPVTLFEERHKCYENIQGGELTAQFMTMTFNCTPFMKQSCPAAVHIDGTARPQLIQREANPSYYDILSHYYELSGNPSLINTSFNMHEEPIVNSPEDAIRAFLQGNLDYLAIGPFLVKHPLNTRK